MPNVLLLSVRDLPHPDAETAVLASELAALGVSAAIVDWRSAADQHADLTVVRSTWDYHQHAAEFVAALRAVAGPVLNPVPVIEWNIHKGYLLELAAAGVPVVPTHLVRVDDDPAVPDVGGPVVIKPAVSASGTDTARFAGPDQAAADHLRHILASKDVLVQPLLDLSADGERSLLYFGGQYSHTVRKMPADGEFRVQVHHGGSEVNDAATSAELAVAERAFAAVPGGSELLFARVDLAGPRDSPVLMELELIEPQLFLDRHETAPAQLAQAIVQRLT